ncbi:MAG: RNA polymerase sigma factor [Solirubrobacterales bacterium]
MPQGPRQSSDIEKNSSSAEEKRPDSQLVQQAVRRAKKGDMEAMHFLYVRYSPDVQRYVNSFVHDEHEAEDIAQNIFAKLITAIGKYEERDVPFTAWILRVSRNAALDHIRARRAIPTEEVRATDAGHNQTSFNRGQDLRQALEQLPDDQREVLVLRHIVGLSPLEIADALGKTESSVHGLHHRGRRTLRTNLVELGAAPVVAARPA